MDVLELLYDYFEEGERAAALIRQRRPLALGFLGALAGGASVFVAEALGGRIHVFSFSLPSLMLTLLWQAAALFALTAAVHLSLDMTGARGDAGALFVHLGLSELAWLAAVPATLILQALFSQSAWPARLAFVLVWFWSLTLKARGLRGEYGVGAARAWLTLVLPYALFAALIGASTALAIVALAVKAFSA